MRRNRVQDFFSGLMFGLAQVLSPIQKVLPTPPENVQLLPPNLNSATQDELVDLLEISPELAQSIVANRPYLDWDHFKARVPQAFDKLRGKVRF